MVSVKGVVLTIAIAIILTLFIHYGVQTFVKAPSYSEYQTSNYLKTLAADIKDTCNDLQPPVWCSIDENNINPNSNLDDWIKQVKTEQTSAECDTLWKNYYEEACDLQKKSETAQKSFEQTKFIILVVLGIVCVVVGGLMFTYEGIGTGILGGGVLTLIYGTLPYWRYMGDITRFLMLGFALVVLIAIGVLVAKKEMAKKQ